MKSEYAQNSIRSVATVIPPKYLRTAGFVPFYGQTIQDLIEGFFSDIDHTFRTLVKMSHEHFALSLPNNQL